MKYNVTYACGHEGIVNLFGKMSDRDRKLEWLAGEDCPACRKAYMEEMHRQANESALEQAKANNLPELTGTQKQVAWAATLRQEFIDKLHKMNLTEQGEKVLKYIIEQRTSATDWIDRRRVPPVVIFQEYMNKLLDIALDGEKESETKSNEDDQGNEELKPVEKTVLIPENSKHDGTVIISINKNCVEARYHSDEDFAAILRSIGYSRNGAVWSRKTDRLTGAAEDRAAELGCKLLNAGFSVELKTEKLRQMATEAAYSPEQKKWVELQTYADGKCKLAFIWPRNDENSDQIYWELRKIKGSRWSKPYVTIPIDMCNMAEDFADLWGFKFLPEAKMAIERYRASGTLVSPAFPVEEIRPEPEKNLQEILNSSCEVLEELKDD